MPIPRPTSGASSPRARALCLALALGAALAAGACASATKRLEQGQALEERGRPAEAAGRYVEALKKDPALADARAGLQRTGDAATAQALEASAALEGAGRLDDAVAELLELDRLRARADEVGVRLAVPDDYAARRQALVDRAIDEGIAQAAAAMERQQWSAALDRLARVTSRYRPGREQAERVARIRLDAETGWADAEMRAGRFRSAYDHAARALAVYGAGDERGATAAELRAMALERGTITVAVLPIGVAAGAESLPEDLLDEVEEDLARRHWTRDELFVRLVDETRTMRAARHLLRSRDVASMAEATRLARQLDADMVVSVRVGDVARARTESEATRRPVRTTTGQDTAFTVHAGRERVELRISYEVLVPGQYTAADRGSFTVEAADDYRHARYPGDWHTLALGAEDRMLFTGQAAARTDERLTAELAERLSPRLADAIFETLRRQVR